MKQILIASTSTVHGSGYLEYLLDALKVHFKNTDTVLFIPYARPGGISHQEYTEIVKIAFSKINKAVKGLHEFDNPKDAIKLAQAIFTGGGNTFVLVNQLYKNGLMSELKSTIESGTPYLGTSAGSNICGLTIGTSNDMPIMYPPNFNSQPVIGLREGSFLEVKGSKIVLMGPLKARVFEKNKLPYELESQSDLSSLN